MPSLIRSVLNRGSLKWVTAFLLVACLAAFLAPQPSEAIACGRQRIYYHNGDIIGGEVWLPVECGCEFYSWGLIGGPFWGEPSHCDDDG